MNQIQKYQICRLCRWATAVSSFWLILSCSSVKYVPDDRQLLDKYKFQTDNPAVGQQELKKLVRQKPNKRIIWLRFHLWLYNLSDIEKEKGIHNWLRKIGEEPVIFDPVLHEKTRSQINQFLANSGYFEAELEDTILIRKRKATPVYTIRSGMPHTVSGLEYQIEDTALIRFVIPDTLNALIKKGNTLNMDNLYLETARLEAELQDKGYKDFSKLFVFFTVDTLDQPYRAQLICNIKSPSFEKSTGNIVSQPHKRYFIERIIVKEETQDQGYKRRYQPDTIYSDQYVFYKAHKGNIHPELIRRLIAFQPGSYFSNEATELTYRNLSSIRIYKNITIQYKDLVPGQYNDSLHAWPLECVVQLTPSTRQGYSTELEATNSGGEIGVGGNLLYQHKNLFGAAENLDIRLNGAVEFLQKTDERKLENTLEFGGKTSLTLHQFLMPIRFESFTKRYNPKTVFSISYIYHLRPDFTKTSTSFTFGYTWQGGQLNSHRLNLVEVNTVDTVNVSPEFWKRISTNPYLANSYRNHFIYASSYSFVYNSQKTKSNLRYFFLRYNLETAGNLITGLNKLLNQPADTVGHYQFLNREYSQYIKTDLDIRRSFPVTRTDNIVARVFGGAGFPRVNSLALPYDRSYYSGGSNSLRAWHPRDLGPGSYTGDSTSTIPYQTGDIKLEANLEYRFKLFWVLEAAMFADAGNIWAISGKDSRRDAKFEWDRFYKEIAIGAGLGIRFNLNFVLFRTDFAIQVRDPAMPEGKRIVFLNDDMRNRFNFNFGIGYPF